MPFVRFNNEPDVREIRTMTAYVTPDGEV